jgi:cellulose synthase (UDP-forming)
MDARQCLPSQVTVSTEKVFRWWDYALYMPLTALRLGLIIYFLFDWFSFKDWLSFPFSFSIITIIILAYILIDQLRWFSLPFMKRPQPMTPRPGWKVGVVTTFVPGAEPLEMLEETVKALVSLNYPHETWVLDEGDDARVKALCLKLGAHHFSRKNLPHYQTECGPFQARSKHSNYNAWFYEIGFECYEIITAFDPDHVPDPSFLSHVLGFFEDPKVAYVQVAQAYYNQKASFIARGAAEETYRYYSSTLMASYGMAHPVVIGCHNTHRVTALQQVGGFAPHDADDLLITLFYRNAGWQGVYLPKLLARGLTPVDWNGYLTQQLRWARSVFDIKYRLYPKLSGKLSFKERILSLLQGIEYSHGLLVPIMLLQLAFMLVTGITPAVFSFSSVSKIFLLYFALQISNIFRQRFYLHLPSEWGFHWRAAVLRYAKWPYILLALFDVILGRRIPYTLTRKTKEKSNRYVLSRAHLPILALVCTSCIIGIANGHPITPLLHILSTIVIVGSLILMFTEHLNFPDPFERTLSSLAEEVPKRKIFYPWCDD